ncbi:MAG: hypothetical protein WCL53_08655 [Chloroflexota bacterium]
MRIGIDFDGVICDAIAAMIAYASTRHGLQLSALDCIAANGPAGLTTDEYTQLIVDTHRTDYQFEMQPVADVVDVLQRLADAHELFVVTARRDAGLENAVRWSDMHGLTPHIRQFVSSGGTTKAALCDSLQLDVLIDDFERNLDGLPASVLPVLWHAEYNAEALIEPPRERIASWLEFHERLEALH